jgi:formylglycine-generating enzyme required for sulfatase activity
VDAVCLQAQAALIAGDVSPGLSEHIASCAVCDRVRRLSELLVTRSRGAARVPFAQIFTPGQELLRYRLDALIGEGGQGVVFRATELDVPESVVALKVVYHGGPGADESVKEVSFAKRINHPNVCRVHHTAVYGAFRIIEMEHLPGGTLASRLAQGLPSRAAALRLFRGVLAGIEAVHRHGILHLDLKPLNVLLRDDGEPVVTDFGMATRAGGGAVGGTSGWTAPEVERGESADARADVYSLGALLGALLPSRSDALEAVVARATAARAADRYPDVPVLRRAFEAAASDTDALHRRRSLAVVTAVAATVAVVAAAGWHLVASSGRPAAAKSARAELDSDGARPLAEGVLPSAAPPAPVVDEMASVPAGTFRMGSSDAPGSSDEHPEHPVRIAAFRIDRTEVTVAAYDACARAGRCTAAAGADVSAFCNEGHPDRANHPINCVDWTQADEFCRWAGKRLPTEEEWEYAARGTDGRTWPWGNDPPSGQLCWNRWKTLQGTCAVGSFAGGDSPFGLRDMAGNVWEWTSSGYSTDYRHERDSAARVNRGGCWYDADPAYVRSAHRDRNAPAGRFDYLGFRCAR